MVSWEFLATLLFADPKDTRKTQDFGFTSFGKARYAYGFHTGIDLVTPSENDYIISPCDGEVVRLSKQDTGYGYSLIVKFQSQYSNTKSQWYSYRIGHLETRNFADGLYTGAQIKKGQRLGRMGTTGNSTGEHLHFEIFRGVQNPYEFLQDKNRFIESYINPLEMGEIVNIYQENLKMQDWNVSDETNRLINMLDQDTRRMIFGAIANKDLNYILQDSVAIRNELAKCKVNEADTPEEQLLIKVWNSFGGTIQKTITDSIGFGVAGLGALQLAGVNPLQFLPDTEWGKVIAGIITAMGLYIRNKTIPRQ